MTLSLEKDEVIVDGRVWWKMKHAVPYLRVMPVNIVQGPISRCFGIGSVHVHTVGYLGQPMELPALGLGVQRLASGVLNFVEDKKRRWRSLACQLPTAKARGLAGES